MTDDITVSRELLRQVIDALNEADNVLTSSMFAEAANALRAELEQAPVHVLAYCDEAWRDIRTALKAVDYEESKK